MLSESRSKMGGMLLEDCAIEAFSAFYEGLATTILPPEGTPSSILGASLQRLYRMPRWEAALGVALSLVLHASILLAAMLFPRTLPHPVPEPQFVMVSFAEAGQGGTGGEEGADGGHRGKATNPGDSPANSPVAGLDTEHPTGPPAASQTDQPAVSAKNPPQRLDPLVPESPTPQQPAAVSNRSKLITRQPARSARPKPEKQNRNAPAAMEAPQTRNQSEPHAATENHSGTDSGQTPAILPGAGGEVGPHPGEGTGMANGKGGSHHGPGAGAAGFTVKQVDRPPVILRKVEPEFPEPARKMGLAGKVVAKLLVGADGHVSRASIVEAVPEGIFEQGVLTALRQWEFKPGYFKNQAVATWVVLPITFRLSR